MNIGITGHQKLKNPLLWKWVASEINDILGEFSSRLIGFSSLAVGADQVFAEAVLNCGGKLQAIIPFDGYELKFTRGADRERYFRLLHQAAAIETLEKRESNEAAYFAAGQKIVESAEIIVAVWDGKPAAGLGGTGDMVAVALKKHKKIIHINPDTQKVERINF